MATAVVRKYRKSVKETWVAAYITPEGATIPALAIMPKDETTLVDRPCAWCNGAGESVHDEFSDFPQEPFQCQACGGSGKSGTMTVADMKREQFRDAIFWADAPRAERRSWDCCPVCGGGHDDWCDDGTVTDWFVDARTGEETLVMLLAN